ncbi:hypothetical protein ABPG74_015406 [Tetrahymena malaccensis]
MSNSNIPIILSLTLMSLVLFGLFVASDKNSLTNSTNTTTFSQWAQCYTKLNSTTCDDIKNNSTEQNLCYSSSYQVGQLTYDDSNLTTTECHNFHSFFKIANSSDMINTGNHYFYCYMSREVQNAAYQSQYYYNKIYRPIYITCAGY